MLMPDVNILVYAHRREDSSHEFYRAWVERLANGNEPFALSVLVEDGIKEFAVLPYQEFLEIQQILQDFEDLQELREAKAEEFNAPTRPLLLSEVTQKLAYES